MSDVLDTILKAIDEVRRRPAMFHALVLCFFIMATLLLTYPVIVNMTGSIAGTGDAWQVMYIFWYAKQAILGSDPNMTLTYTNYLYYPAGVPMIFYAFSFFSQLLSIPLQSLFGLPAAFNIIWLLSFILAGYGAFLLVRYVTGSDAAGVIGGLIFAFSPYHMAQAQQHLGATTIEWIPFCALFLIKAFREKGMTNAIIAGFFFIMVALSDSQYMVYVGMFSALLFCYAAALAWKAGGPGGVREAFLKYAAFIVIGLLGAVPVNYGLLRIATSQDDFLSVGVNQTAYFSGDLAAFFMPSPSHPAFGGWLTTNVYGMFTGTLVESTIYAGYMVLALSIIAILAMRRQRGVLFWGISAISFAIMTLGPYLHVFGLVNIGGIGKIPMPYLLLYYLVPFLDNGRTVSRFDVIVMLSLAVLAGYGVVYVLNAMKSRGQRALILCLIGAFIIFEFLSVPVISPVTVPGIYQQMAADGKDYAVLELPVSGEFGNYSLGTLCEFYRTVDRKHMVNGPIPRTPDGANDFETNTPYVYQLEYPDRSFDIFNQDNALIGSSVLDYYNIRYVILHKQMPVSEFVRDELLLNNTAGMSPAYEDDDMIAYSVASANPAPFMVAGNGWYPPEYDSDRIWRWGGNRTETTIVVPASGVYDIHYTISSFMEPRAMDTYVNGVLAGSSMVPVTPTDISMPLNLTAGSNKLLFSSPQDSVPYSDYVTGEANPRMVSFVFMDVSLTRQ